MQRCQLLLLNKTRTYPAIGRVVPAASLPEAATALLSNTYFNLSISAGTTPGAASGC